MLLLGEVTATAWLPTCDFIFARQWSYPVSALSGLHLPGKPTAWRRWVTYLLIYLLFSYWLIYLFTYLLIYLFTYLLL